MFDLVISNGKIVNGAGNPWFKADVAVSDGRIVKIGKLEDVEAERTIDADGLVVAPGFVDMHNHSDFSLLVNGRAESMIRQGLSTIVYPNCGSGAYPLNDEIKEEIMRGGAIGGGILDEAGVKLDWSTAEEYFSIIGKQGSSVNVAPLIGFGTVRRYVMGWEMRAPTKGELERMKAEVEKAMQAGAFGLTTGLRYVPQSWSETEEVIELAKVVAKYGGFYTSHLRDEGDRDDPVGAIREIIEIGERAGLPVNISHFKILAKPYWDKCDEILGLIEEARARGVDVTADQYPYPASGTGPRAWCPRWAHEGGVEKLRERLRDPELGGKIRDELERVMNYRGGPKRQLIVAYDPNLDYIGKTIADIAEELGIEPSDTLFNLYQDYVENDGEGNFSFVSFNMSEENVDKMMRKPWVMVSTDGIAGAPYGILAKPGAIHSHPRSYGSYPRVLRNYVGERKLISLEEAIRKMTSLEMQRLGIYDRGLIAEGIWADITLFDPDKVIDKATYLVPRQYPEGIPYVIVNGVVTIDDGEHTGALAGKVLRKTK